MSGGRVELGIGTGWYETEHDAYGIPFGENFNERFERLTEQLEIITGLWGTTEGETFSYDGKYYHVKDSPALPKPVQRPHPPIILGGFGPPSHPEACRAIRGRVQHPLRSANDRRRPDSGRSRSLREARTGSVLDRPVFRPGCVCRSERGGVQEEGRSDRASAGSATKRRSCRYPGRGPGFHREDGGPGDRAHLLAVPGPRRPRALEARGRRAPGRGSRKD